MLSRHLIRKQKTLEQTTKVRHVVYFAPISKEKTNKQSKAKDVVFHPIEQFEERGRDAEIGLSRREIDNCSTRLNLFADEQLLNKRPDKSDLAVIMYTSGSTGTPKG